MYLLLSNIFKIFSGENHISIANKQKIKRPIFVQVIQSKSIAYSSTITSNLYINCIECTKTFRKINIRK